MKKVNSKLLDIDTMDNDLVQEAVIHGFISLVISLIATYAVHIAIPSQDIQWALIAVALAGFFSSASSVYALKQE